MIFYPFGGFNILISHSNALVVDLFVVNFKFLLQLNDFPQSFLEGLLFGSELQVEAVGKHDCDHMFSVSEGSFARIDGLDVRHMGFNKSFYFQLHIAKDLIPFFLQIDHI